MKDTLTLYDELIAGGCTESQARVQARQLGDMSDVAKDMLTELKWLKVIGLFMIGAFVGNLLFIGWKL